MYVQKHPALFCQDLDKAWVRNTWCFYFFSGLMKFLLQLTWERLSHQACLLAGSVSFQSRSQSVGYRDVVYTLPVESNTSKLLHSVYSSRSERSLCVKSDTRLLHNLLIVGGQLERGDLAFLQVEKLLLSSLGPSFVTVDIPLLIQRSRVPPTVRGDEKYPVYKALQASGFSDAWVLGEKKKGSDLCYLNPWKSWWELERVLD